MIKDRKEQAERLFFFFILLFFKSHSSPITYYHTYVNMSTTFLLEIYGSPDLRSNRVLCINDSYISFNYKT
jgi:hypothetical protein